MHSYIKYPTTFFFTFHVMTFSHASKTMTFRMVSLAGFLIYFTYGIRNANTGAEPGKDADVSENDMRLPSRHLDKDKPNPGFSETSMNFTEKDLLMDHDGLG